MSRAIQSFVIAVLIFVAQLCLSVIYPSLPLRLFLGIAAIYFAWKAASDRHGSNSPIGIYVVVSAIYVFAALTEVAYFGNRMNLDPLLMGTLTDMGVAFLLCVVGGYLLLARPTLAAPDSIKVEAVQALTAIWTCGAFFILTSAMTFAALGASIGALSRADIYSQDLGLVSVLRGTTAIGLGIAAALLVAHEARIGKAYHFARLQLFAILALYTLQDLLIFGDRRLPLMALLGVGCLFLRRRFTWTQVASATALGFVLFIYGYVRNTPPSLWLGTVMSGTMWQVFSPTSTEFGGLAIIGQALGGFSGKVWNYPTYLDAFLQILPRSLFPDRPLAPTEWFMDAFYPALSAAGASYAFNQVIEARLNGGILGIIAVGLATGAALSLVTRLNYRGAPIGYPIALYVFVFSMRMDFASILRTAVIAAIGAAIVLAAAESLAVTNSGAKARARPS